jgi:hypothetical protein
MVGLEAAVHSEFPYFHRPVCLDKIKMDLQEIIMKWSEANLRQAIGYWQV